MISQTLSPDGAVLKTTQSRSLGQAVSPTTADQLKQAMLAVVESGSGTAARVSGVKVAGKTGHAEASSSKTNSTFIGFAPYDTPTVAVSIVLEDIKSDEYTAASIASKIISTALAAQGS